MFNIGSEGKQINLHQDKYESKNWVKIPLKFVLWLLFLAIVFNRMRRKKSSRFENPSSGRSPFAE
jgi:hypothetical protein